MAEAEFAEEWKVSLSHILLTSITQRVEADSVLVEVDFTLLTREFFFLVQSYYKFGHSPDESRFAHAQFVWDIKSEPGVVGVFEKIWGTDELTVSFGA